MDVKRTALCSLSAALVAAAAACSASAGSSSPAASTSAATTAASPAATAASLPSTPVGAQARWLLSAVPHAPIPNATISAHFDQAFLAQAPPSELNATFASVKSVTLDAVTTSTSDTLVMTVTANGTTPLRVSMATDPAGLIAGLLLSPAGSTATQLTVPTSWAGVERQVRAAAPQAQLLVARVTGGTCQPVQASGAATPAPLGSAFKLYVLDALARAVAAGKVGWDQPLTVTSQQKSLPSGTLQNDPDGTKVTVRQAADAMISVSDNTAANMLMALLGRPAVEAAAADAGLAEPSLDTPFLSTRELFVLKLVDWPTLASRYLAATPSGRQALLTSTIDAVPYSTLVTAGKAAWNSPRDINSLEWFASAEDMCRVYASLAGYARQPELAPLAAALQINDGGLGLSTAGWQRVWFKGGSEPGVLTLNYLATTKAGQTYEVSLLTENPHGLISSNATLSLLGAVKGAFQLAAG
jgi:beta-lactamase class A